MHLSFCKRLNGISQTFKRLNFSTPWETESCKEVKVCAKTPLKEKKWQVTLLCQ